MTEQRPKDSYGMPPPEYEVGTGTKIIRALLIGFSALMLIPLLPFSIRVVNEYERGVIFRLGRLIGAKGPGLFILLPFVDRMVKVDLRTITLDVPAQEAITRDNVTVKVNAVVYFRVVEPTAAVVRIMDHIRATSQISQTTLRSVLGQSELDELLGQREQINQQLQRIIDEQTEPWGVKVTAVEIKDVELPASMQRAMARQAEAERERRAKIIAADGEYQASERLREAALVMAQEPITVQLRFLQTLTEVAAENNSTIVFPIPVDLIEMFLRDRGGGES
ncbi:Modulator of FtsH protease HflK [bacterium HR29]|nr:Modulator of FtsH protease HflK [bacterium HR29]